MPMKANAYILAVCSLLASLVCGEQAKPRLALCPSGDEQAKGIVALMETMLSKDGGVVLLDRANVGKVLAEHKLALEGLLSVDDALKAGQLLQCDIFAELHGDKATSNTLAVISIVAFDAATGVRLCDQALARAGSLEAFATSATEVLAKAIGKRQRKKGDPACLTLSLLSVRSVDLPSRLNGLGDCLRMLVARQLVRSPDVALLERSRLEHVNKESGLTGDRRGSLLASTILLDLDASARGDTIKVRASMSDAPGKEIGSVSVEGKVDELGPLSEHVVNDVLTHLRLSPIKEEPGARLNEAERLAAEFHRLKARHSSPEAVLATAESAFALASQTVAKQMLLCEALEDMAGTLATRKEFTTLLDFIERDLSIREEWIVKKCVPSDYWGIEEPLFIAMESSSQYDATLAQRMDTLRHRYHDFFWKYYPTDKTYNHMRRTYVAIWANNADEWLDGILKIGGNDWPNQLKWVNLRYVRKWREYGKQEKIGGDRVEYRTQNTGNSSILNLSKSGKQRLMDFYAGWENKGSIQASMCAALTASIASGVYPDADKIVEKRVTVAVDQAIREGPAAMYYLCHALEAAARARFPTNVVVSAMKAIVESEEKQGVTMPNAFLFLDTWDKKGAEHPGAYIEKAVAQLKDSRYRLAPLEYHNPVDGSMLKGGATDSREENIGRIRLCYRLRYGKEMDKAYNASEKPVQRDSPWISQEKLFSMAGRAVIKDVELAGDTAYVLTGEGRPETAALHSLNLKNGSRNRLGTVDTTTNAFVFFDKYPRVTWKQVNVGQQSVYVPTSSRLLIFPLNGGRVRQLIAGRDLPEVEITSVIEVGGKLYLGCCVLETIRNGTGWEIRFREGLLVQYDLERGDYTILASSARRQQASALDNCPPYSIPGFFLDKTNERLGMVVAGQWPQGSANMGLWSLNLTNGAISKVRDWYTTWPETPRRTEDGGCLLGGWSGREQYLWNTASNAFINIAHDSFRTPVGSFQSGKSMAILNDGLYAMVDRAFSPYEFKCLPRHKSAEDCPLLPNLENEAPFFLDTWHGTLIACTRHTVWRLRPTEDIEKPPPRIP